MHGTRNIYPGIYSRNIFSMNYIQRIAVPCRSERAVRYQSNLLSTSSLSLIREGGLLVLGIEQQNNRLHNKYIVVLAVVKIFKFPKLPKSSLSPMGEGFCYLQW